jgi:neuromedin U receptor 1
MSLFDNPTMTLTSNGVVAATTSINWTSHAYLEQMRGPQRHEHVIAVTMVYGAIFVVGVVGNVCTCVVIARNRYMQTATNCYLFNLALTDLLMLIVGLLTEMYVYWVSYPWPFGLPFCLIRSLAAEASTYASIITITAFHR